MFLTGDFGGPIYWQILSGGSVSFDAGDPNATLFAPNMFDVFVAKYDVDESVSIAEANAASVALTISPNPVDRFFTLTSTAPFDPRTRVVMNDALGREMIAPVLVRQTSIEVDATTLTPGAYTITVANDRTRRTQHFIKN